MHLLLLLFVAGGWDRSVQQDPMWDFPVETFRLQGDGAAVTLTMFHDGPTFSIRTDHFIHDQYADVTYRFGTNPPYQERWLVSHDGKAVLVPKQRINFFLNRLLTEPRLIFRVAPHRQEVQTVIFETQGLGKQLAAATTSQAWRQLHQSILHQEKQLAAQISQRNQTKRAADSWLKSPLHLQVADLSFNGIQAKSAQDDTAKWGWAEKEVTRYSDGTVKSLRLSADGRFVPPARFNDWLAASNVGSASLHSYVKGSHLLPQTPSGIKKVSYQVAEKYDRASVLALEINYHPAAGQRLTDWSFELANILRQPRSKAKFYLAFDENGRLDEPMGWESGTLRFKSGLLSALEFHAGNGAMPMLPEVLRWLHAAGIEMESKDLMQLGETYRAQQDRLPDGVSAIRLKHQGGRISELVLEASK